MIYFKEKISHPVFNGVGKMTAKHCKILLVKRPSKTRTRNVIFRPRELNTLKYGKWNLTKRKALKVPEKKKGN